MENSWKVFLEKCGNPVKGKKMDEFNCNMNS